MAIVWANGERKNFFFPVTDRVTREREKSKWEEKNRLWQ
jgi:hypothetical protein